MIYINVDGKKGNAEIEGSGTTGELLAELTRATVEILRATHIETREDKVLNPAEKVMYYAEKLSLVALAMKAEEREENDSRK